jgi:hypothetical protein
VANHAKIAKATGLAITSATALALAAAEQREHQWAAAEVLPQGHSLSVHGPVILEAVTIELNNRPRERQGGKTPPRCSTSYYPTSTIHPVLR